MRTDFLNEATIMGQFNHDHVIKLYGVVTRVDPAMIVMEFMDNGSLYSYLRVSFLVTIYLYRAIEVASSTRHVAIICSSALWL